LDGEDKVDLVIPGHQEFWSWEKLDMWRDYIVDLWAGVNSAKKEGLSLNEVLKRFPLDEKYFYVKDLGHDDNELRRFQTRNVQAFWRQLFVSVATVVEQELEKAGIEAAVELYHKIKTDTENYLLDENQFNALGYRLLQTNKIPEAIEIFKLNVQAFPQSWNVYDSLAEAYMIKGENEAAIKYYEKSLDLNPQNDNGREMIKRLKEKK
jgi:tetratricopeptide (TPR) repeat protein